MYNEYPKEISKKTFVDKQLTKEALKIRIDKPEEAGDKMGYLEQFVLCIRVDSYWIAQATL